MAISGTSKDDKPKLNRIQTIKADIYVSILVVGAIVAIFIINSQPSEVLQQTYPQIHYETIANLLFKNENMTLATEMYARTFSAHEDILVSVQVLPNNTFRGLQFASAV